jgi:inner membrane protein
VVDQTSSPGGRGVSNNNPAPRQSTGWGGKALLVFALAVLMAIPALFVLALISDRTSRAQAAVNEVSALQGGAQQVLGPVLIAPYALPKAKDGSQVTGWYVVSAQQGQATAKVASNALHRGIFQVPVYDTTVDLTANFAAPTSAPNLPAGAAVDWSAARFVVGFSDLRGAKRDISGQLTGPGGKSDLAFSPASGINLGDPSAGGGSAGIAAAAASAQSGQGASSFGLVSAPAGAFAASHADGQLHAVLRFTGAQRLSVLPFAKSTSVSISGDWRAPSFDGGFLPEQRQVDAQGFRASWSVPFIARGLSDQGDLSAMSLQALGPRDLGVSFVPANNPYQNVMRALKYAVMFVGLVFLTFFVFEALSTKRLHPAQYVMIGLAQMVFYLLLLSLSEYIGFDIAFAVSAVATVGLISLYAGWAFQSRTYQLRALVIFTAVYGLIYLLMRLEDFALLAGSIASFVGLSVAMYLTRNIDWYGGRAEPAPKPAAST